MWSLLTSNSGTGGERDGAQRTRSAEAYHARKDELKIWVDRYTLKSKKARDKIIQTRRSFEARKGGL
jgi:hypothetical protein